MTDSFGERMDRLEQRMDAIALVVDEIHDAIVGNIRQPGGLAVTVQRHEQDITAIRHELAERAMRRDAIVAEYDDRVTALESWITATKTERLASASASHWAAPASERRWEPWFLVLFGG